MPTTAPARTANANSPKIAAAGDHESAGHRLHGHGLPVRADHRRARRGERVDAREQRGVEGYRR